MESRLTLEEFLTKTNPHPRFNYAENSYNLYDFLLGNAGWREVSLNILRPRMQRFLFWALELTSAQKQLGWSTRE